MATAGRPAIAIPCRPRKASNRCQVGANALSSAKTDVAATDQRIRLVRPRTSDAGPAISNANPRPNVANETLKALWLGETWKASTSSGSNGCVL